jgi:hypothetical protein
MKKGYEKPAVIYSEEIEARAVRCVKLPGNPGCQVGPITS